MSVEFQIVILFLCLWAAMAASVTAVKLDGDVKEGTDLSDKELGQFGYLWDHDRNRALINLLKETGHKNTFQYYWKAYDIDLSKVSEYEVFGNACVVYWRDGTKQIFKPIDSVKTNDEKIIEKLNSIEESIEAIKEYIGVL